LADQGKQKKKKKITGRVAISKGGTKAGYYSVGRTCSESQGRNGTSMVYTRGKGSGYGFGSAAGRQTGGRKLAHPRSANF